MALERGSRSGPIGCFSDWLPEWARSGGPAHPPGPDFAIKGFHRPVRDEDRMRASRWKRRRVVAQASDILTIYEVGESEGGPYLAPSTSSQHGRSLLNAVRCRSRGRSTRRTQAAKESPTRTPRNLTGYQAET